MKCPNLHQVEKAGRSLRCSADNGIKSCASMRFRIDRSRLPFILFLLQVHSGEMLAHVPGPKASVRNYQQQSWLRRTTGHRLHSRKSPELRILAILSVRFPICFLTVLLQFWRVSLQLASIYMFSGCRAYLGIS